MFCSLRSRKLIKLSSIVHHNYKTVRFLSETRGIYQIKLKTCEELYGKPSSLKKWYLRFAPRKGIDIDVEYVDTDPQNVSNKKTLLALHGSPGSYLDYLKLIEDFGHDYRLIAPSFPDFSVTERTGHFWHSSEEKAQFIRDLLNKLGVTTIDCLIAHSAAIYPASHLWVRDDALNNNFKVKSLALFNCPSSVWLTKKQSSFIGLFVNVARVKEIRAYLRSIWSIKMTERLGGISRISDYDTLALMWSTVYLSNYPQLAPRLLKLKEYQIPTFFVMSQKDKLMGTELFYNTLEILGAVKEDYDVYEKNFNHLVMKGDDRGWLKVVNFHRGGHYCYVTFYPVVHQYLRQLLARVDDSNRQRVLKSN